RRAHVVYAGAAASVARTRASWMGRPGPAPPPPVWKNEFKSAIGSCACERALADCYQRLRNRLGGNRRHQDRIAGRRLRPSAPYLGQDERPGWVIPRPHVIQAA